VTRQRDQDAVEAYVQRALAARITQGLPEHIDDTPTLDFLADVLSKRTSEPSNIHTS
jgi:hypothetical protein